MLRRRRHWSIAFTLPVLGLALLALLILVVILDLQNLARLT